MREGAAARRAAMIGTRGGLREALLAEIASPTFDRDRVATLVEDGSAQRQTFFVSMAQDLHAFVATLTPEQREKFLKLAQKRGFLLRLLRRKR